MRQLKCLLMVCSLLSVWGVPAAWSGPGTMHYQGRLLETNGQPVVTTVTMTFTFWNAEAGGVQLGADWSDTDIVQPDAQGYYATEVGDVVAQPIPVRVFGGPDVFLNIMVNGENLVPRKRVSEAGFAVTSERVNGAETGRIRLVAGRALQAGDIVCINDLGQAVSSRLAGYETLAVPRSIMERPESIRLGPNRVLTCSSNRATLSLINGDQITQGGVAAIGSLPTDEPAQVIALDDYHALVMYTGEGLSYRRTLRVLTASGPQLTMGPEVAIDMLVDDRPSFLIRVSATRALVMTPGTAYHGDHIPRYRVLNIAGTTITPGTMRTWSTPYVTALGGFDVGDDQRVILFRTPALAVGGYAELTQVDADEITLLASADVGASNPGVWGGMLKPTTAVIRVKRPNLPDTLRTLTLCGNTITPGPETTMESVSSGAHRSISLMPPDRLAVTDGNGTYLRFGQVTGTTITLANSIRFCGYDGSPYEYRGLPYVSIVMMAADKVFATYGYFSEGAVTHEQRLVKATDASDVSFERRFGVAEESAAAGQECLVTVPGGITEQYTGLQPGSTYKVQENGPSLSGNYPIGLAVTPTRLFIQR